MVTHSPDKEGSAAFRDESSRFRHSDSTSPGPGHCTYIINQILHQAIINNQKNLFTMHFSSIEQNFLICILRINQCRFRVTQSLKSSLIIKPKVKLRKHWKEVFGLNVKRRDSRKRKQRITLDQDFITPLLWKGSQKGISLLSLSQDLFDLLWTALSISLTRTVKVSLSVYIRQINLDLGAMRWRVSFIATK